MIEYAILPDQRLIVERMKGRVSLNGLGAMAMEIWGDSRYDKSFNIVVDVRGAVFDMKMMDIEAFSDLILSSEDASLGRTGIISSKPVETALSFVFSKRLSAKSPVAVFSTWEGVGGFLGIEPSVLVRLADEPTYEALFESEQSF